MFIFRCPKHDELNTNWWKTLLNTFMAVSIFMLIATFAASFKWQGGVNKSDDPKPFEVLVFTFFNTIAMYNSIVACIVLILMRLRSNDFVLVTNGTPFVNQMLVMALCSMCVAYWAAARLVVRQVPWVADFTSTNIIASIFRTIAMFCCTYLYNRYAHKLFGEII